MKMADMGDTKPAQGVMPTRPTTAPVAAPTAVGTPRKRRRDLNVHAPLLPAAVETEAELAVRGRESRAVSGMGLKRLPGTRGWSASGDAAGNTMSCGGREERVAAAAAAAAAEGRARQLAPPQPPPHEEAPREHGGRGAELRVGEGEAGRVACRQRAAGVEAKPAEPEQRGAEQDEGHIVRDGRRMLAAEPEGEDERRDP